MHEVERVLTAGLTLSPREREVLAYELLESIERDKSVAPASDPLHAEPTTVATSALSISMPFLLSGRGRRQTPAGSGSLRRSK